MKDLRTTLDHPLVFLIVITIGVLSLGKLGGAAASHFGFKGVSTLANK